MHGEELRDHDRGCFIQQRPAGDAQDRVGARLAKLRDTVFEFVDDLSDQQDDKPQGQRSTDDTEAAAAIDAVPDDSVYADLPVLGKTDLAPEWQGANPVLCVAGRTLLDEAAAIMVSQLFTVHGLAARVEGPDALATANLFRLEPTGVRLVCLSYLDTDNIAHIRYAVRRLRRKLPLATIMVGCWASKADPDRMAAHRDGAKADLFCSSFREAVQLCVEAARTDSLIAGAVVKAQAVGLEADSGLQKRVS